MNNFIIAFGIVIYLCIGTIVALIFSAASNTHEQSNKHLIAIVSILLLLLWPVLFIYREIRK